MFLTSFLRYLNIYFLKFYFNFSYVGTYQKKMTGQAVRSVNIIIYNLLFQKWEILLFV